MSESSKRISIGKLAERTGLSHSAIRFYETEQLVSSIRSAGGHRLFKPSDIRRLSFILIAQKLGFTLEEIRGHLASLPLERTPTQEDWAEISTSFREVLNQRIEIATRMRDRLDGCIGCGCLSLSHCAIYNPDDQLAELGPGPRHVLENS